MIADFRYDRNPSSGAVRIELYWKEGERFASLCVPSWMARQMAIGDYPSVAGDMSVSQALSYGVFLAMRGETDVAISGDATVWDGRWGDLNSFH